MRDYLTIKSNIMNQEIKTIQDNEFYAIKLNENLSALKLAWKQNNKLDIMKFKEGIKVFAESNKTHKPKRAVIDARQLDPNGDPFGWVSGQTEIQGIESYYPWWEREVAPILNESQISGLGVATGDPNAPGEIPSPEVANFKIAYFTNFDQVLAWEIK